MDELLFCWFGQVHSGIAHTVPNICQRAVTSFAFADVYRPRTTSQ